MGSEYGWPRNSGLKLKERKQRRNRLGLLAKQGFRGGMGQAKSVAETGGNTEVEAPSRPVKRCRRKDSLDTTKNQENFADSFMGGKGLEKNTLQLAPRLGNTSRSIRPRA